MNCDGIAYATICNLIINYKFWLEGNTRFNTYFLSLLCSGSMGLHRQPSYALIRHDKVDDVSDPLALWTWLGWSWSTNTPRGLTPLIIDIFEDLTNECTGSESSAFSRAEILSAATMWSIPGLRLHVPCRPGHFAENTQPCPFHNQLSIFIHVLVECLAVAFRTQNYVCGWRCNRILARYVQQIKYILSLP